MSNADMFQIVISKDIFDYAIAIVSSALAAATLIMALSQRKLNLSLIKKEKSENEVSIIIDDIILYRSVDKKVDENSEKHFRYCNFNEGTGSAIMYMDSRVPTQKLENASKIEEISENMGLIYFTKSNKNTYINFNSVTDRNSFCIDHNMSVLSFVNLGKPFFKIQVNYAFIVWKAANKPSTYFEGNESLSSVKFVDRFERFNIIQDEITTRFENSTCNIIEKNYDELPVQMTIFSNDYLKKDLLLYTKVILSLIFTDVDNVAHYHRLILQVNNNTNNLEQFFYSTTKEIEEKIKVKGDYIPLATE